MFRRFLVAASLLACALAFPPSAAAFAAIDDQITSQANAVPREFVNPMLADATAPAAAPVATPTVVAPAPSAFSDFAQWAIGMIGTALSALAGWALVLGGAKLGMDAKSAALASVQHLVDEGIDWVRQWAVEEAKTLSVSGAIEKVLEVVWPLAKNFVTGLGWTEDHLRTYIGTRLTPTTA